MGLSKARKGLGEMIRHAMRNHHKCVDKSHETVPEFRQDFDKMSDFFSPWRLLSLAMTMQASSSIVQTDHYKKKESHVRKKLAESYARNFGTEAMFSLLPTKGKEAGVYEYTAAVKICIQQARRRNDVESALDHIGKAIEYLKEINKRGFILGKGTYVPLLKLLLDMEMVEEFQICKDVIIEANPKALGKVGYYEMLLWIQVNDEEKIQELCTTVSDRGNSLSILQEKYLAALCEKERWENVQRLLEIVDITKVSSPNLLKNIFGYLGRSLLESMAMKFLRELRKCGKDDVKTVSSLIISYATCIPDSMLEAILKFKKLHQELDIMPSSTSYDKLITSLYEVRSGE